LEKQIFFVSTINLHVSKLSVNELHELVMKSKENKLHRICSTNGRIGKCIGNCGGKSEGQMPQLGTYKTKRDVSPAFKSRQRQQIYSSPKRPYRLWVHPASYSKSTRVLARG
jgi:hypothetical protein